MRTRNHARLSGHAVAAVVVFAFFVFLSAPFIIADNQAKGVSDCTGMSSSDAISANVSLGAISPLTATYRAAEQSGLSPEARSLKHWLYSLQLLLVTALSFGIFRTRGLSMPFLLAVVRISPISISLGGHAPPLFRA